MGLFDFIKKKDSEQNQAPVAKKIPEQNQAPAAEKFSEQNQAPVAEKISEQNQTPTEGKIPEQTSNQNAENMPEPNSEANPSDSLAEKEMLDRLCSHAGNTIAMLKGVLSGPKGTDMYIVTIYAAGLAGIACHEAVKALGKPQVVVETKDGKKYFMGDEVNKYLHENKYSVTGLIRTITETSEDKLLAIITKQSQTIGSDTFVINGNMDPKDLYKNIKSCWDGIFNNMTAVYCKSPDEWPIFFGIVLQNVIKESLAYAPKEAIFNTAADIACALSKMDAESI